MIHNFVAGLIDLWPVIAFIVIALLLGLLFDLQDRLNRTAARLVIARDYIDEFEAENLRLGSARLDLLQQLGDWPSVIALPSPAPAYAEKERQRRRRVDGLSTRSGGVR